MIELSRKVSQTANSATITEEGKHIFKLVSPDDVTPQINRSALAAAAVNSIASHTRDKSFD
jgi:hypothetical protein